MSTESRSVHKQELADMQCSLAIIRKETPGKYVRLLEKNLDFKQSLTESTIVLPKTEAKKLSCKYLLDKTLSTTFNLQKEEVKIQQLSATMKKLKQDQENLKSVVEICQQKQYL